MDSGLILAQAIRKAMDTCIEQDILKDILLKSKSEVCHMLLTEYDEKKHMKHIYKEGYEEGQLKAYEKISKLYDILLEEGRSNEMKKAMKDKDYREKLFKEYNL